MERTNREAISEVRGMFKLMNAEASASSSDRLILTKLQNFALDRIKKTTDKRKLWNSSNLFQVLPCIKLKQVPLAECCGYTSQCTISRSLVQLPKIAEGNNFGMLIQGIYSIDTISRKFIESTPDRYSNSLLLGLKTNSIHFWIQDKYLYIGDPNIETVKVSAYFEEDIPLSLQYTPDYCKNKTGTKGCCPQSTNDSSIKDLSRCCPINPYSEQFKCPGYMYADVMNAMAQEFSNTYLRSKDEEKTPGVVQ